MATLLNALPQPRHTYTTTSGFGPNNPYQHQPQINHEQLQIAQLNASIPPYGSRIGYVPREPEDFGDGGAFPEIMIKQYPLDMGRKENINSNKSSSTVAIKVNANGEVQYDSILRENMRTDQVLHSKYTDLAPIDDANDDDLVKPSAEKIAEEAEETKAALEKLINAQIQSARPLGSVVKQSKPTYIRYQSANNQSINGNNNGIKQRIIKVYDMPVDPLDPPKFKHKKLPARPPSPPVPIMHSPPRQITVEDQRNWKVPPCISNWKNNKGYTLPLHQRLAADGRGLYTHVINDKFAKFSESLLIAERQARKEVELRAQIRMKLSKKEKIQKEKELAEMAKKVKENAKYNYNDKPQNNNIDNKSDDDNVNANDRDHDMTNLNNNNIHPERRNQVTRDIDNYDQEAAKRYKERKKDRERRKEERNNNNNKSRRKRKRGRDDSESESDSSGSGSSSSGSGSESEDNDKRKAFEEREQIRKERQSERIREFRQNKRKNKKNDRTENIRQRERDISEKIALGQLSGKKSTESLYDNRLFNQSSGLNTGFAADDTYNLYDKPLFKSKSTKIYRPKQMDYDIYGGDDDKDDILNEKSSKMKPHKPFDGVDPDDNNNSRNKKRFEFEEEIVESSSSSSDEQDNNNKKKTEEDDELMTEVINKHSTIKEKKNNTSKYDINKKGYMYAAGGGGSIRNPEDYNPGNRDKVQFESANKDNDHVNNQSMKSGLHYTDKAKIEKQRKDKRRKEREREYDNRYSNSNEHKRRRRRERDSRSNSRDRDKYNHRRRHNSRDRGRWGDRSRSRSNSR